MRYHGKSSPVGRQFSYFHSRSALLKIRIVTTDDDVTEYLTGNKQYPLLKLIEFLLCRKVIDCGENKFFCS